MQPESDILSGSFACRKMERRLILSIQDAIFALLLFVLCRKELANVLYLV